MIESCSMLIDWLLESNEPWTQYRVRRDLLGQAEEDPEVALARAAMLGHLHVQELIARAASWPGAALRRHNDASHPLYALSVLADFGLRQDDPGMNLAVESLLAHQSPDGAFQTLLNIPTAFGGAGQDQWAWILCDAPTLLYVLLAAGLDQDRHVQSAVQHLLDSFRDNGFPCAAAAELGRFRGPGRKSDPCPVANLYALKALSLIPQELDSPAAQAAGQAILQCWERRAEQKPYLFGMGTDFRKLKYPYVWYDILHVVEVLSRFPYLSTDSRFVDMLKVVIAQTDANGRFTAGSMYQSWKGWSFADKKHPSPWLTFLVLRIQKRISKPPHSFL